LKESGIPREKVILATKVCGNSDRLTWFRKNGEGTKVDYDQIMESVDASLKRLGVEYIDLLQIHWPDRYVPLFGPNRYNVTQERDSIPISEQVRAMGDLIKQGKIRYYGLSNESPYGTMAFVQAAKDQGVPGPISIQNSYSLLVREFEAGLTEVCSQRHENIGLLAYSPLAGGVLTGKYAKAGSPANSRLNLLTGYKDRYDGSMAPEAVAKYAEVASKYGMTPAEFALAFCKSRTFVPSTIIGATTLEQLKENVNAFTKEWTAEMEADVEKIAKRYPEPWRTPQKGGG
jgi:aryl-alcohol dehydrogenase-like predicted oxidoreductase